MKNKSLLLALVGVASLASPALAERRTNGLKDDVAVRHRKLLVKGRFEAAPLFESTINAEFQHVVGGGLKLEYHLSDMLSIGGIGVFSKNINTKLTDRIVPTLEGTPNDMTREPSQDEFTLRLNSMPVHGAGYISLTPWYGKLAAFSQAYVAFDFYFQAGISFAQLKSDCPASVCDDPAPGQSRPGGPMGEMLPPDNNPNNDPPLNSGSRVGLYLGGGIHVFLSDFLALDMTVRDYAFSDNPSGADYNADLFVGKNAQTGDDDNRFLHHLFFGAGVSIMFPTTVQRTP
ncbi:MAG TPA: outer membrane beta-barrel domain-containing protein [Kofleriaceae bacterium]|jgi:outer membrane beta-barrel protein|nr:outer membrane beta-barrel domain-containing protein [Kofleriaceae bacterium]